MGRGWRREKEIPEGSQAPKGFILDQPVRWDVEMDRSAVTDLSQWT